MVNKFTIKFIKKNKLYKISPTLKTAEAVAKYKAYKNKPLPTCTLDTVTCSSRSLPTCRLVTVTCSPLLRISERKYY